MSLEKLHQVKVKTEVEIKTTTPLLKMDKTGDNLLVGRESIKMKVVDGVVSIERSVIQESDDDKHNVEDDVKMGKEEIELPSKEIPEKEECPNCRGCGRIIPDHKEEKDSRPENDKVWDEYEKSEGMPIPSIPEDDDDATTLILRKYTDVLLAFHDLTCILTATITNGYEAKNILATEYSGMSISVLKIGSILIDECVFSELFDRLHRIRNDYGSITAFNKLPDSKQLEWLRKDEQSQKRETSLLLSIIRF